jgi:hypothetical protein
MRDLAESKELSLRLAMLGELALTCATGALTVDRVAYWLERIFAQPPRG